MTIIINPDKTISINNVKTFPAYSWGIGDMRYTSTSEEAASRMEGAVFDWNATWPSSLTDPKWTPIISALEKHYINWIHPITGIPIPIGYSQYFAGYFQQDEATDAQIPMLTTYYNKKHTTDTGHPVWLNHWKQMSKWLPYADILTIDRYTLDANRGPRENFLFYYESAINSGMEGKEVSEMPKPIWAVVSGFGKHFTDSPHNWLAETGKEARANAYTAITMDFKGVGFWKYHITSTYDGYDAGYSVSPELLSAIVQFMKECKMFNSWLVAPTIDYRHEYHIGLSKVVFSKTLSALIENRNRTNFNYILKQNDESLYLIIVNKNTLPITDVEITVQGLTGSTTTKTLGLETIDSGKANRTISINNGKFIDSFDGLAVHIYQIGGTILPSPCPDVNINMEII